MELEKVFQLRQSVRNFKSTAIREADLNKLIFAAESAPLAMGDHDTTLITVLQNTQALDIVKQACALKSAKTGKVRDPFYGAPLVVFLSAADISADHIEYSNVACIIENIHLQATALELGSVYIWGCLRKLRANPEAMAVLSLPDGYELLSAIAIGYPTEPIEVRSSGYRIAVNTI